MRYRDTLFLFQDSKVNTFFADIGHKSILWYTYIK